VLDSLFSPCRSLHAVASLKFFSLIRVYWRLLAVFETWTYEGAFVHENGFQITHEERVDVQLLAQAVHGNEVEMEIEFREIEDFDRFLSCSTFTRSGP